MSWLRVRHMLAARHLRRKVRELLGRESTYLSHCECGWKTWMFRRTPRTVLVEMFCGLRGHAWGEPDPVHVGPVDQPESEDALVGYIRQCESCWRCERVPA